MGRRIVKRGKARQGVDGKGFRLADEIRYIQAKAADHDGRIVAIGQLILFSTDTGDAWLLDVADQLAVRLARDGDPEPLHLEESATSFAIGWKGRYRIEGSAFIYADRDTIPTPVGDHDLGQIQFVDHVRDEPRQMLFRQPVLQRRRQQ